MLPARLWSTLLVSVVAALTTSALPAEKRGVLYPEEAVAIELLIRQAGNQTAATSSRLTTTVASSSSTNSGSGTSTRSASSTSTNSNSSTSTKSTSSTSSPNPSSSGVLRTSAQASGGGLPAPPSGSRLTQHTINGKPGTTATVPIFANKNYIGSGSNGASSAWIGLHGRLKNGNQLFSDLYNVVGDQGVAVVPNFYGPSDVQTVQNAQNQGKPNPIWLQPDRNVIWNDDWRYGADAVAGGTSRPLNGESVSSLEILDSLIKNLSNKSRYPNMARITVVGHSAGAALVDIYSHFGPNAPSGIKIRYVEANTPTSYMVDSRRPVGPIDLAKCPNYNNWPYGPGGAKPRYINNAMSSWSFQRTCSRDVVRLSGTKDTYQADSGGDQSCMSWAQGGPDRTNRGQAAWVIDNLRANTKRTDLRYYASYQNITTYQGGVPVQEVPTFRKTFALVYGVAHVAGQMFASDYGRQALLKTTPISYTQTEPAPY
ncbi:hypothetical protein IE81DRAFT_327875 [Ceraceosorus guamensis]|uniref:Alpha/beta-hydrolase n=1 Tax=Ceraceosorus guamensis TaxID=1522189 RepID=A0A316WDZ1_9BASI|nr:hypothetical protein IE81DRAFT_327875 [Ceraceosorus guamensis]PWN45655.1 hypothetical protein IE81DRAFT_327875 [Ceraceosorus guamensis]